MADDAGLLRDRVKLARLSGDMRVYRVADKLWEECASGRVRGDESELFLLVRQIERSLGRIVDERDFLARAVRDLGEKEIDARLFVNPDRRFTDDDLARLRTIVTVRGSVTETLVSYVEALPVMFSDRMREIRSEYERIRTGDESLFAHAAAHSCCGAAGVGLLFGLFGGPLEMAASGAEAIACC
jgi:hypothetical protein